MIVNGVVHMENTVDFPFKVISRVTTELRIHDEKRIPDLPMYGIQEAAAFCYHEIGTKCIENILALFLSSDYHLVAYSISSIGVENKCSYSVAEIVRCALLCNASNILLAHNHPSGDLRPSPADIAAAKRVAQAAQLFNIKLVDSIVVSPKGDSCSIRQMLNSEGVIP